LDWNQRAIDLYKALGVTFLDEWQDVLLLGDGLRKLAARDAKQSDQEDKAS